MKNKNQPVSIFSADTLTKSNPIKVNQGKSSQIKVKNYAPAAPHKILAESEPSVKANQNKLALWAAFITLKKTDCPW
jgi:hypothetical protein